MYVCAPATQLLLMVVRMTIYTTTLKNKHYFCVGACAVASQCIPRQDQQQRGKPSSVNLRTGSVGI